MFFLIFGTRASKRTVGSGMFFCPNEQSDQSYRQVAVKRMGHLFFIPLLPLGVSRVRFGAETTQGLRPLWLLCRAGVSVRHLSGLIR